MILCVGVETVSHFREFVQTGVVFLAHVLQHQIAVEFVWVTVFIAATSMLVSPFHSEQGLALFTRALVQFVRTTLKILLETN